MTNKDACKPHRTWFTNTVPEQACTRNMLAALTEDMAGTTVKLKVKGLLFGIVSTCQTRWGGRGGGGAGRAPEVRGGACSEWPQGITQILFLPKPYLVLRDTLCSCEAYGMKPMYKKKEKSTLARKRRGNWKME